MYNDNKNKRELERIVERSSPGSVFGFWVCLLSFYLAVVVILAAMTIHASAYEGDIASGSGNQPVSISAFKDLPETDPFYNNIMAAKEAGYVNGIGNDLFGVNEHLRICDFLTIMKRAYDIYSPLTSAEDIKAHTEIDLREYNNDVTQPLTVNDYFEALFCLYGVPTYKVEQNPNGYVGVATELGLVKSDFVGTDLITRKDAIGAFMTLKNGQYQYLFENQVGKINMTAKSDDIDLYLYYGRLAMVPESILRQFINDGWRIEVTNSDLYGSGVKAAGVTYYSDKLIKLNDAYAVVHEMGHYFDNLLQSQDMGHKAKVCELFKAEKDAAAKMIRSYTKTNQEEFFADMFTFYLEDSIRFTREEMKETTPLTYEYFTKLSEQYKLDEVFAYTHEMRPVYDHPWHS